MTTTTIVEVPNYYRRYAYSDFMKQLRRDTARTMEKVSDQNQQPAGRYLELSAELNSIATTVDMLRYLQEEDWLGIEWNGAYTIFSTVYNSRTKSYDLQKYQVIKHLSTGRLEESLPIYEIRQRFRLYEFRVISILGLTGADWVTNPPKLIFVEVFTKQRLESSPLHRDFVTRRYLELVLRTYATIRMDAEWLWSNERMVEANGPSEER